MERQQEHHRNPREGNGKRTDAGSKTRTLTDDTVKHLQKDVKDLADTLKEIKSLLNLMIKDKKNKIPGIK